MTMLVSDVQLAGNRAATALGSIVLVLVFEWTWGEEADDMEEAYEGQEEEPTPSSEQRVLVRCLACRGYGAIHLVGDWAVPPPRRCPFCRGIGVRAVRPSTFVCGQPG
jgi:hypothetical protein